ncbi:MAG: UbiA family prenyltransferase [Armatimonadetes bacterium]|nr:UbiA family prenyltransferase [Armatimonadota bacterium]
MSTATAGPARGLQAVKTYLEMIKVEHSVFALPFAMIGMMYADLSLTPSTRGVLRELGRGAGAVVADGWPGWPVFLLILLAMVSARSAAMAFNRIADRKIDALNPRTARRPLQTGALSTRQAFTFFLLSCALFFLAAALLNRLTLTLAPVALIILLGYSYTKRFTSFSHLFVGLSLGIAPAGAWVAVTGEFSWTPLFWILAVTFWTGGFDVLYSLQDDDFDREHGLKSLPVLLGRERAIIASRAFHLLAVISLAAAGLTVGAGAPYFFGVMFAAGLLIYEQSLVDANDLSRINVAFFTLNGYVAIGMFLFSLLDVLA